MMKDLYLQKNRSEAGNTFFTALVFIFVLVGTLRICCNKTLHEAKLTGIFIQETQGYYLLENLMALARDYAYQITQNPREPNLFLSASAYRKKDKTYVQSQSAESEAWVINFNGSLSKEQIVPDDFPLKIDEDGWDIKGGPIFWQDKKKDNKDERWLSEVFMLGTLNFTNTLIPNWTMRMVQTMEIERNPLCDFQIYSEGELSFTTWTKSYINRTFYGPIQINGSARFPSYRGEGGDSSNDYFRNKINIAGHALRGENGCTGIKLPQKYHMQDNSSIYDYDKLSTHYRAEGRIYQHINNVAINNKTSRNIFLYDNGYYSNTWEDSNKQSYEHKAFELLHGNFSTRSRIYRPCGFDPIGYGGYWMQGAECTVGKNINTNMTDTSLADSLVLDTCFGLFGLCSCHDTEFSTLKNNNYLPNVAIGNLRGLNAYQATEKYYLTNLQFPSNGPGLQIGLSIDSEKSKTLETVVNWPFTTYLSDAFPAKNDNQYLNRYLSLRQKKSYVAVVGAVYAFKFDDEETCTSLPTSDTVANDTLNITSGFFNQSIRESRLIVQQVNSEEVNYTNTVSSFFKQSVSFSPTSYDDNTCPPHKLIDCGAYWAMDNCITRIKADESYQFMYDRNRAKWIQIFDLDVSALKDAIKKETLTDWDAMQHTVRVINTAWPGSPNNGTRNYTYISSDGTTTHDIRYDYDNDRKRFFGSYSNGTYESTDESTSNSNVVDIGIRIINASELPTGGLTIVSQFPVYIKGNFNSVPGENETRKKACIIADSITVLSDNWGDWNSQMDPYVSYLKSWVKDDTNNKQPSTVDIYAHLITGRTHPNYWIKNDSNLMPDLGLNDAIRTLEYWGTNRNRRINIYGSIMLPYYAHEQWEPPINFTTYDDSGIKGYGAPPLGLGPKLESGKPNDDTWKSMRTAPGIPFYHRINRGRKTQAIGETSYNTLEKLYEKDWDSTGTFSSYHSALPNFLQYETAP